MGIDLKNLSPELAMGAIAELERRKALKLAKIKPLLLDDNFPEQRAFIEDPSRFVDAQCSRRSGKSSALGRKFVKTMEKHPGSTCIYLALTRDSARETMWPVMNEINDDQNLGFEFTESKLIVTHPNGSRLRIIGADMKNFIKRLRGIKSPGVAIDEAQDFGSHLESLVDDVITPMLADYTDGWLALTGTPGPVPMGYFFDVTQLKKFGFSHHEWTILNNPFMPNPEKFISDLIEKKQWTDSHPTLQREWRNKWVLDVESLWIKYNQKINDYQTLPSDNYTYIAGIDIGFNDADAIAVIAFSPRSPTTYLVEERITAKQGLTELVHQLDELNKKYKFAKMIIDEGGLGKKLAEEIRRRHAIPLHAADKSRKQETVEFLNDALRLGKFMSRSNSRFVQDSYLVQIDWEKTTPDRIVLKKGFHSDIIDAALYAFKESPAYAYVKPKEKPKYGSLEWQRDQTDGLFEKAQEFFQNQDELRRINQDS